MTTKTVRTAGSYLRVIEHKIGSDELELDHLVSINHAASTLENARRWEWMKKSSVTLTPIEDQEYIELPADVRDVVSLTRTGSGFRWVQKATLDEILSARADGMNYELGFWCHSRELYDADAEAFGARLELYPTPNATDATYPFTLLYHARIPRVSEDNDLVILPDWIDPVFEELVCAVAWGREEPELGSVEARTRAVLAGRMFEDAATRDGNMQDLTGSWSGGAVETQLARQALSAQGWPYRITPA